jgi:hypothetical protein
LVVSEERCATANQHGVNPDPIFVDPNSAASAARLAPPIAMSPSAGSAHKRSTSSARLPEASRALP